MKHLHRRVIITGVIAAALIAGAYALLGIGFAAIVAVGIFIVLAIMLTGLIVFEEEARLPWWEEADGSKDDHGYHPAR
jgi:fatty acid desaturase